MTGLHFWRNVLCAGVCVASLCCGYPGRCADNLLPNPEFRTPAADGLAPFSWQHGTSEIAGVRPSRFSAGSAGFPPRPALGVTGGEDRAGEWRTTLQGLEQGKDYRLFFKAFRENFAEGAYPEVELFGRRTRLSNFLSYGGWQDFGISFTATGETTTLRFINDSPETFYFSSPSVMAILDATGPAAGDERCAPPPAAFFPLVAYGAGSRDFPFLRDLGFTGAVLSVNRGTVREVADAAARAGLRLVVRADDEAAVRALADSGALLGWYVEDEPEGRSVPVEEIRARVRKIRDAGSCHPTYMAMVRPEFAGDYRGTADILLMDQYPIPANALVWLSRSMEEARRATAGEVWAVIQIFGGQGWQGSGWERAPTFEEMKALSYLAVVHGARGLFFYTVKDGNYDLRLDAPHREDLARLLRELGALGPWLLGASAAAPAFVPTGLHAFAPDGTAPVHARLLASGDRKVLIAVNVLDKTVQGRLTGLSDGVPVFKEHFSGRNYVVRDLNIVDEFKPYAVKIYVAGDAAER